MIVTRFAPSPTGFLHIGSARTALFNWLYAKHTGGKFLLRIEDTDQQRSTQEAIDAIINSLEWLGLNWDGDLVMQSSRIERHRQVAKDMLKSSHAYECYATAEEIASFREQYPHQKFISPWRDGAEPRAGVPPVIRIKAPLSGVSIVNDHVQGSVQIDNSQLDDMVMLRSDGTPTYMLAVVVDDHDMGVNTVIRGDDHFTNAFRQNLIYQATMWPQPSYTHIPLIHGADGNKLSKRHGATAAEDYRDMGYLPGAILNYLLRLGWSHGDDEIISLQQAIEWFDLPGLGKSPSRFDFEKLNHINAHYLRSTPDEQLSSLLKNHLPTMDSLQEQRITTGMYLLKNRANTVKSLAEAATIFLHKQLPLSEAAQVVLDKTDESIVNTIIEKFKNLAAWDNNNLTDACKQLSSDLGLKPSVIMQTLRALVVGSLEGPSILDIIGVLGRNETLNRIVQR
jgi:glutamyl-tRNA synthetase